MKRLLDTKELARLLNKSEWWVRTNREPLEIPSKKLGAEYRFDLDEILEWLASRSV